MVSNFLSDYLFIEEQVSLLEDLPYNGDLFLESLIEKDREKINKNLGIIGTIGETIRKIITSILNLIEKILKGFLNYGDYLLLSKEEKNRFNKYCAFIDSHQPFKKQKIKVRDWKAIEAGYKTAEERAKKVVDKAVKENKNIEQVSEEFNGIFKDLNTVVNAASVIVTADMAKSLATQSRDTARLVEGLLLANRDQLKNMDTVLGDGSSKKLMKDIHKMTNHTFYRKFSVMMCSHKKRTIEGYMRELTRELGNISTDEGKLEMMINNPGLVGSAMKVVKNKEVIDAGKRLLNKGK